MKLIKVAIIAECLWQEALANLINPSGDVVVVASTNQVEDLVAKIDSAPDIVLIDFDSPQVRDGETVKMVKDAFSNVAVIGVASRIIPVCLISTLEAGVGGCLLKTCSAEQLVRAIRDVLNNEAIIDLMALQLALRQLIKLRKQVSPDKQLTSQEMKIVKLTAEGLNGKEIAQRLSISERTVSSHFRNIFGKLEVDSRLEAVLYAARSGWVS
jgi:Response regulator containing a CheY-like receiver domain and an HTH DNA-binding domain